MGQVLFVIAGGQARCLWLKTAFVLQHAMGGVGVQSARDGVGSEKGPGKSINARLLNGRLQGLPLCKCAFHFG